MVETILEALRNDVPTVWPGLATNHEKRPSLEGSPMPPKVGCRKRTPSWGRGSGQMLVPPSCQVTAGGNPFSLGKGEAGCA